MNAIEPDGGACRALPARPGAELPNAQREGVSYPGPGNDKINPLRVSVLRAGGEGRKPSGYQPENARMLRSAGVEMPWARAANNVRRPNFSVME